MNRAKVAVRFGMTLLVAALVAPSPARAQVGKSSGVLEANLATKEQLVALPGVSAAVADALIQGRPYADMTALDKVLKGKVGDAERGELYKRLFLPINLNTATREEILLIPGVGPRLVREFFEYRPFKAMAQFRREFGKYMDAAEVARIEQYVFIPLDLNTASDEDMLTIPGVGARMLKEFKEYRPWKSAEQFRREIGKYVSKEEVARLERYVTFGGN
jgi:DNA uptake protein ComE-like DNA-binding protein